MRERFLKSKPPEEDMGAGFGYKVQVYFEKDLGKLGNRFVPKMLRRRWVCFSGGGMNLAKARELKTTVEEEFESYNITTIDGQPGQIKVIIEKEIPIEDFPVRV